MLRGDAPDEPPARPRCAAIDAQIFAAARNAGEIIAGVEMDLRSLRYPTFKELRVYCYRVASAVGLVSIEIFGYRNPRCREYAINLGTRVANDEHHSRRLEGFSGPGAFTCRRKIWRGSTIRNAEPGQTDNTTSTSSS
jgi:hypothetical protein